jgi:hypothetical protein
MSCENFCVTLHYYWDGAGQWETHPICYRKRRIIENIIVNGRIQEVVVGETPGPCWESDYVNSLYLGNAIHTTLATYHQECSDTWHCGPNDYFTIDDATRARCFSLDPSPDPFYSGLASPPPPPPKRKKMCCDCNTIATIVEDKIAGRDKAIKDHIDQRTIEELKAINKMLQGMQIDLNLQPVIDRLNQVEANLWNGPTGGG